MFLLYVARVRWRSLFLFVGRCDCIGLLFGFVFPVGSAFVCIVFSHVVVSVLLVLCFVCVAFVLVLLFLPRRVCFVDSSAAVLFVFCLTRLY